MNLKELRELYPSVADQSDTDLIHGYAGYFGLDPSEAARELGVKVNKGLMGDLGTSLKRGVQQIPGTITGLADLPAAAIVGGDNARPWSSGADWLGEKTGFRPSKWAENAQNEYSPAYRASKKEIDATWDDPEKGKMDVAGAYLSNPGYIANQVVESLPGMAVGGLGSRAMMTAGRVGEGAGTLERVVGSKWASPVAAGAGEGAVTTGQQMDQYKGPNQQINALASLGAGVITGGIGVAGGRLAQRLGFETPETLMAGRGAKVDILNGPRPGQPLSAARRIGGGAITEGVLQEFPQSVQEQMWQNLGEGKPIMQGAMRAGVEGGLAGAGLGGTFNIRGGPNARAEYDQAWDKRQSDFDQPGAQPQPNAEAQAYLQEQQAAAAEQELQAKRQSYVQAAAGLGANPDEALAVAKKLFAPPGAAPLTPQARVYTPEQQAVIATLPEDMTPSQISDHIDKLNKAVEKNQKAVTKEAEKKAKLVEQATKEAEAAPPTPEEFQAKKDDYTARIQKVIESKFGDSSLPNNVALGVVVENLKSGNLEQLDKLLPALEKKAEQQAIKDKVAAEAAKKFPPKTADAVTKSKEKGKPSATKTAEAKVPVLQKETQPAAAVPTASNPAASEGVKNGYTREGLHQGFVQTGKGKGTVSAETKSSAAAETPSSVPVQKTKVKRPKVPKDQAAKDAVAFAPVEVKKEIIDGQEVEVKVYSPEATAVTKRPRLPKDAAAPAVEVPRIEFDKLEPADKKMVRAFMGYNDKGELAGGAEKGMSLRDVAKHVGGISHVKVGQRLKELGYTNDFKKQTQESNAPAAVEEATTLATDAQIESDLAAEIAASEQQAATEREKQKSGHLVDENGEDLSDTESGMHEDTGDTAFMEQGAVGGTSDTGQGWKSLLKNKVPFTDKRWTEVRMQAAVESLSEAPETNMHVLEQILGEVTRREANARAEAKAKKLAATPAEKLEAQAKEKEANIVKAHELVDKYNEANGTDLKWEDFGEKQQTRLANIARKLKAGDFNEDRAIDEVGVNAQQIGQGLKYSEGSGAVPNHTTGEKIFSVLNNLFFSPERLNKILKVYETQADFKRDFPEAAAELEKRGGKDLRVAGMEYGGKAAMIAENLTTDKIMSVFLHEVGVHLGMETLIGKDNLNWLADRVEEWAKRNDNSVESKAAKLAIVRAEFSSTPAEHMKEELVAYMVQNLVEAGVDPQAAGLTNSNQWFRRLWAAAKLALRTLGFKNPNLTGQQLVDLAFGAAQIQLEGAWHGTAADFRKFDHAFMSSGEGAQAFGWGTYIAERVGIAKAYWDADVRRKGVGNLLSSGALSDLKQRPELEKFAAYIKEHAEDLTKKAEARGGMPARKNNVLNMFGIRATLKYDRNYHENFLYDVLHMAYWDGIYGVTADGIRNVVDDILSRKPAGPGSLMAASYNIRDNEWLKLDKAYTEQSPLVQEALKPVIKAIMQKDPSFFVGHDPDRISGKGVYNKLTEVMSSIRARRGYKGTDTFKNNNDMYKNPELIAFGEKYAEPKQAASLYLDSLGIKGNKFLDQLSREPAKTQFTLSEIGLPNLAGRIDTPQDWVAVIPDNARVSLRANGTIMVETLEAEKDAYGASKINTKRFVPYYEILRNRKQILDEEDVARVTNKIKDLLAAENSKEKTYNMVVFNHDNVVRVATKVGAQRDAVKFSVARETETAAQTMFQEAKDNAQVLFDKATVKTVFGHDLAKIAVKAGLTKAQGFFDLTLRKDAIRNREIQEVERIMQKTANLPDRDAADKFLRDSTTDKQWGFAPSWNPEAKVDAGMEKRFLELKPATQEVVREIFEHGHRTYEVMRNELNADINAEYDALIAGATDESDRVKLERDKVKAMKESTKLMPTLQGPYAPLKRFGDYAVILASPAFMKAKEEGNVNLQNNLIADSGTLHHSVEFFDTKGQANTAARKLEARYPGYAVKSIIKQEMFKTDMLPWGNIAKLRNAINEGPDTKYKTAMQRIALEMYLRSVAETSARKAQIRRKGTTERAGVAGSADMFRAFAAHGQATAHYIAALQGNKAINKQISEMRTEAKQKDTNDKVVLALNEIMARYSQSLDYRPTPLVDKAMRVTSLWMLATSPAYYLQNSMQTWMLTLPVLAGKYKEQAAPAIFKAYGDVMKTVKNMTNEVDIQNLPVSAEEKAMLKAMWEGGKLDIGINAEMGKWTKDGGHNSGVMDTVMQFIDKKMVQVELLNRMTAALAAYRLSKGDAAYAAEIVDTTHGNYAGSNAPRFFHASGLTKLVTQFRKYQLIQISLLVGLAHQAFKSASPAERSAGRLALSWLIAQQLAITGMYGTVPTALMVVAGAMGGDDDKDWERNARRAIGDDKISDFLMHGIPAGLGLDVSKKLGINNAFSILPFADTPTDKSSYEKAFTAAGGAFFGGLGPQAFSALKYMKDGDYYKGIETALPKGLRDAMKGYRYATEGITSGRNDVLLKPDEVGALAGFAQAVGLPTTSISNFQRSRGDIIELSKHFTDQDHELKNDYAKAARSRDSDRMAELREEWKEQQESKKVWTEEMRRQGFRDQKLLERLKPQPLGNLLKAPQDQGKREQQWAR